MKRKTTIILESEDGTHEMDVRIEFEPKIEKETPWNFAFITAMKITNLLKEGLLG